AIWVDSYLVPTPFIAHLDSRHGYGTGQPHQYGFYPTISSFIRIERYCSTPCEELTSMKIYLRRLQIICSEKERTVSLLRQDKGHHESDTLYQLAWNEYQDVQSSLQQAVSDFGLSPPVPTQAAHHVSPKVYPLKIHPHLLPLGETLS
ncbi:hypothetical protein TNCV_153061, partial [Trichonephila clavipes]